MSVDYRLLARFEASRHRLEAARQALPLHWQADPRPEAQIINEHWVAVMAQAMEHREQTRDGRSVTPLAVLVDDSLADG